jgi:hypothetical protein
MEAVGAPVFVVLVHHAPDRQTEMNHLDQVALACIGQPIPSRVG